MADLYEDSKDTLDIAKLPAKDKEKIRARLASALEDLKFYKERKREEQALPTGRQQVDTNDRKAHRGSTTPRKPGVPAHAGETTSMCMVTCYTCCTYNLF